MSNQNSLCFGNFSKFPVFSLTGIMFLPFSVFPVQWGPCIFSNDCQRTCRGTPRTLVVWLGRDGGGFGRGSECALTTF